MAGFQRRPNAAPHGPHPPTPASTCAARRRGCLPSTSRARAAAQRLTRLDGPGNAHTWRVWRRRHAPAPAGRGPAGEARRRRGGRQELAAAPRTSARHASHAASHPATPARRSTSRRTSSRDATRRLRHSTRGPCSGPGAQVVSWPSGSGMASGIPAAVRRRLRFEALQRLGIRCCGCLYAVRRRLRFEALRKETRTRLRQPNAVSA